MSNQVRSSFSRPFCIHFATVDLPQKWLFFISNSRSASTSPAPCPPRPPPAAPPPRALPSHSTGGRSCPPSAPAQTRWGYKYIRTMSSFPEENKKGILSLIRGVEYSIFDKSMHHDVHTPFEKVFAFSHPFCNKVFVFSHLFWKSFCLFTPLLGKFFAFFTPLRQSFSFSPPPKKLYMGRSKIVPLPTITTTKRIRTLSSPWSVGCAADKKIFFKKSVIFYLSHYLFSFASFQAEWCAHVVALCLHRILNVS